MARSSANISDLQEPLLLPSPDTDVSDEVLPEVDSSEVRHEPSNSVELIVSTITQSPDEQPRVSLDNQRQPVDNSSGTREINRNIRNTLIYTVFAFAGRSIWNQSVLATYVYILTHDNPEAVGFMTAVQGTAQLLASIPAGYIADKHRRDFMLRIASGVGCLAVVATLMALYVFRESFNVLVLALAVWGCFFGIVNVSIGALFADSINDGDRAYWFTTRAILLNLGNTVGPALGLITFFILGDRWTVVDCCRVMTLGQVICLPAIYLLALFDDDDAFGNTSRGLVDRQPEIGQQLNNYCNSQGLAEPLLGAVREGEETPSASSSSDSDEDSAILSDLNMNEDTFSCSERSQQSSSPQTSRSTSSSEYVYRCIPKKRVIPILVAMADLTAGLASGMSIRYFPIFFVDTLRLGPVAVQLLFIIAPLLQACFMKTGQHYSKYFGRCQVVVVHKWIGITCMGLLIAFTKMEAPTWLICVVYILRTAMMNSTAPLTRSILMDNVPAEERGRWGALESVNMFSWSGSSFVGGILVSLDGILFNFTFTAAMQFVATIPLLALQWAVNVDKKENNSNQSSTTIQATGANGNATPRRTEAV